MNSMEGQYLPPFLSRIRINRGMAFGVIIITALLAFEIFNYSTTDFALSDLLGGLDFMGIRWATILAVAFCGIDFAGIARLFTPEEGDKEPNEVWYLFGAWLLAATMNAMLTWWGVSLAVLNHNTLGNEVVGRETLLRVVPIFVAVLVWLIRVLMIGTFSVAGEKLFSQSNQRVAPTMRAPRVTQATSVRSLTARAPAPRTASLSAPRPAPKPVQPAEPVYSRPEPTYHSLAASAPNYNNQNSAARPTYAPRNGQQNRR